MPPKKFLKDFADLVRIHKKEYRKEVIDFFKPRSIPEELKIFRALTIRKELSVNEKQHYLNMEKGFEGELEFDQWSEGASSRILILNDLQLECNHTTFQVDSLLITPERIIPCEIKNYDGDYIYKEDNFFRIHSKRKISNPLHQLNRIEILLGQLLQKQSHPPLIKGHVIFINPQFFLYQAPIKEEIIFYPQLPHLFKTLTTKSTEPQNTQYRIAEQLLKAHTTNSPNRNLPAYDESELKKGFYCHACRSFEIRVENRKITCMRCQTEENTETAVIRCIDEFKLLFPHEKVTTNAIQNWCQFVLSKKTIGRILKKNYKVKGYGQWTYYE